MEPVEVTARWNVKGEIIPLSFTWQEHIFPVVSTGRCWRDKLGEHILCMVPGDQVFELIYNPRKERWYLAYRSVRPSLV
jgi:hypothetical protein